MGKTAIGLSVLLAIACQGEVMAQSNHQYHYRAPGDHSIIEQHFGANTTDSTQSAVSLAPGRRPNTIVQNTGGGSGNTQTAVITGGGGNTVVQDQTGSGNREIVTQTGTGNRAVQIQRGSGKTSIVNQRGHGGNANVIQDGYQ